jgi:hypothetical protein
MIEELKPLVKIEKSSGNVTYYQVFYWVEKFSTQWSLLMTTIDRSEAERCIGDQVKRISENDKNHRDNEIDRYKHLLISFDLPAKP